MIINNKIDKNAVKERLMLFIRSLGISTRKFEMSVDWSNGYVSNMSGNISMVHLSKLSKVYPGLSIDWLLYGQGKMLNDTPTTDIISEPNAEHGCSCPFCKEKDALIESLREQIKVKDELLAIYKKNSEEK